MIKNEQYPLDYTGHGPSGAGHAPTEAERRRVMMNRFHADRMSQAMQYIDPTLMGAAATMYQAVSGSNSPGSARRDMYSSAAGQAALDAAMLGRVTGMLGTGSPLAYAANMTQGVAGGGFTTSFGGTMGGQPVYGNGQRVNGTGAISERVSLNYGAGLMRELYGKGDANAGKLNGFNMEDASHIFRSIASQGGVGHAAHIERNADVNTRLAAARAAALDPDIQKGLADIKVSGSGNDDAELQSIIDKTEDKKLKKELEGVLRTSDATFVNTEGPKKTARVIEEVTKGLSNLMDIYGQIGAPKLMQVMERLTGSQVGANVEQAQKQNYMVQQMRGAAEANGLDPLHFMEASAHRRKNLQGRLMAVAGFDERTSTFGAKSMAMMDTEMSTEALYSATSMAQSHKQAYDAGIRGLGPAPPADEIYADKRDGRMQFIDRYQGVTMALGGMDNLSGENKERAQELLDKFRGTTDATKRRDIDRSMRGVFARAASRPGDPRSFENVRASRTGQVANNRALTDHAMEVDDLSGEGRQAALLTGMLATNLEDGGVAGPDAISDNIVHGLGLKGMNDLLASSKNDKLRKDKGTKQVQMDILKAAGLSPEDANAFRSQMFNADGSMKNEALFKKAAAAAGNASYEGASSVYEAQDIAQKQIQAMSAGSTRKLLSDAQGVSLNSIATAIAMGDVEGISNPESMALALQAMDAEGIKVAGAEGSYATNIDFSDGLTAAGMKKLAGVAGADLKLHEKVINPKTKKAFTSEAELIAASEKDKTVLSKSLRALQSNSAYVDLNLQGGAGNLTAVDSKFLALQKKDGTVEGIMQDLTAVNMLAPQLSDTEMSAMKATALDPDQDLDLSMFSADEFSGDTDGWLWGGRKEHTQMGEGLGKIIGLQNTIKDAKGGRLTALARANKGGRLTKQMQAQYDEILEARDGPDGGAKEIDFRDEDGKAKTMETSDENLAMLKAMINKLDAATEAQKGGAQTVGEIVVNGNIRVEGKIDDK